MSVQMCLRFVPRPGAGLSKGSLYPDVHLSLKTSNVLEDRDYAVEEKVEVDPDQRITLAQHFLLQLDIRSHRFPPVPWFHRPGNPDEKVRAVGDAHETHKGSSRGLSSTAYFRRKGHGEVAVLGRYLWLSRRLNPRSWIPARRARTRSLMRAQGVDEQELPQDALFLLVSTGRRGTYKNENLKGAWTARYTDVITQTSLLAEDLGTDRIGEEENFSRCALQGARSG
ncbi:hypothetical protein BKA70DRAFT_1231148 [Coprinopsis sp. MPI-PUGE-AT-0042]|nr:hypothetical protein BKA70DRAFT_1231148 [Coprinopsis sp. MPI-PUGE-AT-0042]